jgi:circadian clock protein KaiC
MKSRGMKHSNQVREFVITDQGLDLIEVYVGPEGVLTGSARETQMLLEETGEVLHTHAVGRKDREIVRKRKVLEAKIESLRSEFESTEEELNKVYIEEEIKRDVQQQNRRKMSDIRTGKKAAENERSQSSQKKKK